MSKFNNIVGYFNTIEQSFAKLRFFTILAYSLSAVIAIGSLVYSSLYVASHNDNIFVVDNSSGVALAASKGSEIDRSHEIELHVKEFHRLMFNLPPSREAIDAQMDEAFKLCDRSAYEYYNDQDETGFYQRLEDANVVQWLELDSLKIDMSSYPYREAYFGKVYLQRQSRITKYDFVSTGQLVDVGRSSSNPHGLLLERFRVVKNERIETRSR